MISFILCLALLIIGYFTYGKVVDNTFGPDDRETPAVSINDGVDYVVMPQWKLFLVQLLNIAGLGPIFGAMQGALWGPIVFLWITFGTIFAGGVHDYFSGMISERNSGSSVAEFTGKYLGGVMQNIMRVFSVVLLIMVGTVFAVGPAGLIVTLCKNGGLSGVLTTTLFWLILILVYYFIATFISIDKIIGKIYPVFGLCLIIMAVGVIIGIYTNPEFTIPEIWSHMYSMHPAGPIFGAMQGALWGPIVFLWITFGTIFAGGVHDYFSGMISERNSGSSVAEFTGKYLGGVMQNIMRVFSVVLLIMVGTVFAVGPAGLIVTLCKNGGLSGVLTTTLFWLILILVYYFIATFISIDKIIGKIYPVFGLCLIIMAVGVIIGIYTNPEFTIPEIWSHMYSMHPAGTPIWSFMFITVACGAISGFHSTQSPLMARCMKSEKQGHFVFYGAMVAEGIIALIWAAAGCALYEVTGGLNTGLAEILSGGQSAAIYDVCSKTMGGVGIALAMIGVVVCPITSGDTAFRSARLTLSDWFHIDQGRYANRLKLCIPVLGVGAVLGIGNAVGAIDYTVIWRYFSWTNQTLAMIVLWAASMYLVSEKKNFWITAVPATFMSAVSSTYFILAPECLGGLINSKTAEGAVVYNTAVAYPIGIIFAIVLLVIFLRAAKKHAAA